jgi:hypothetical protein
MIVPDIDPLDMDRAIDAFEDAATAIRRRRRIMA